MPPFSLKDFPSRILLIGAGHMGGSMLEGWLSLGLPPERVCVVEPRPSEELLALVNAYPAITVLETATQGSDIVILAVKPQLFHDIQPQLAFAAGERTLVVSILAGKTLAGIGQGLSNRQPVVRAMPNTPASIGRGMTVLVGNANVSLQQKEQADQLMQASGAVAWIEDEDQMDAVTAVSGSGPAYVFLLTETLAQAGIKLGLAPELAALLARQTVSGAGELQFQSQEDVADLRRNVTSPNGTTAAALNVLMGEHGLKELMENAVTAAALRSRELAG